MLKTFQISEFCTLNLCFMKIVRILNILLLKSVSFVTFRKHKEWPLRLIQSAWRRRANASQTWPISLQPRVEAASRLPQLGQ